MERVAKYKPAVLLEIPVEQVMRELDYDITSEEIEAAVKRLRNTGPGVNGVHAAVIKALWRVWGGAQKLLDMIIKALWAEEEVPQVWPRKADIRAGCSAAQPASGINFH